jgi:hypothetical protein
VIRGVAGDQVYRECRLLRPHQAVEALRGCGLPRSVLVAGGARIARRAAQLGITGDVLRAVRAWKRKR